eukprot:gene1471-1814_t
MAIVGCSGAGKSTLLDCMLRMSSTQAYLPDTGHLAPSKVLPQVKQLLELYCPGRKGYSTNYLTWDVTKHHPIFGDASMDGVTGRLISSSEEVMQSAYADTQRLIDSFVAPSGSAPVTLQQGFLLPVYSQSISSDQGTTTRKNVVLMRSSRNAALLACFTEQQLMDIVKLCHSYQDDNAGDLPPETQDYMEALFELEKDNVEMNAVEEDNDVEEAKSKAVLRAIRKLPTNSWQLCERLLPEAKRLLGKVVQVHLPNRGRQHDTHFLRELLVQLNNSSMAKPIFMHMVCHVFCLLDEPLLPQLRGLLDMAGLDTNPFHEEQPAVDANVQQRLQAGKMSMVVVGNDKEMLTYEALMPRPEDKWDESSRRHVASSVLKSRQNSDLAKDVQSLRVRPLALAALLGAVAQGQLQQQAGNLLEKLQSTGISDLFTALNSVSGRHARMAMSLGEERRKKLAGLTEFLRGNQHRYPVQQVAQEISDAQTQLEKLKAPLYDFYKAKLAQKDMEGFLEYRREQVGGERADLACLKNIRNNCWFDITKQPAEKIINIMEDLPNTLASREDYDRFYRFLLLQRQSADVLPSVDAGQRADSDLLPTILAWPAKVNLQHLNELLLQLQQVERIWLRHALDRVSDEIPADSLAASVLQLHLEHLLPLKVFQPGLPDSRRVDAVRLEFERIIALKSSGLYRPPDSTGTLLGDLKGDLAMLANANSEVLQSLSWLCESEDGDSKSPEQIVREFEADSAKQITKLYLLYHRHHKLLSGYDITRPLCYDYTPQESWAKYSNAFHALLTSSTRSASVIDMGNSNWRQSLPDVAQERPGQRKVDVMQMCSQFVDCVLGLEGQILDRDGAAAELDPGNLAQQAKALHDQLVVELLLTAQKELRQCGNDGKDQHHLSILTGYPSCSALLDDKLECDPFLLIALLAQLTGNTLYVLVEHGQGLAPHTPPTPAVLGGRKRKKRSSSPSEHVIVRVQPARQQAMWLRVAIPSNAAAAAAAASGPKTADQGASEGDEEGAQSPAMVGAAAADTGAAAAAGRPSGAAYSDSRLRDTWLVLQLVEVPGGEQWTITPITSRSSKSGESNSKRRRTSHSHSGQARTSHNTGAAGLEEAFADGPEFRYPYCSVCMQTGDL